MRVMLATVFMLSWPVLGPAADEDVVEVADAAGFKTLVAAVKAAGLVDTLKGEGPFTVFAPTDEAFAKLPAGALESLLKPENKEKLQAVLTYHVVAGRSTAADVAKLDGKSVRTVLGKPLEIRVKDGAVRVGDATVTRADVAASNGVIHVVDAVLLPPAPEPADSSRPATSDVRPKPADGDAPLAEGFPDATKPGVIEVKKYPAYRSAVARSGKANLASGDMLFFPLFNHIQRNRIAMTAPVINTYGASGAVEAPGAADGVTMEFVYRSPEQGKAGPDGANVEVEDHPAGAFVCLGLQGGGVNDGRMRESLATLHKWLAEHKDEWVEAGPPRRLGYHGPTTPPAQRLWEIQIPVKPAG